MLPSSWRSISLAFVAMSDLSSALTTSQFAAVEAELRALIPTATADFARADSLGGMLRLPFHDAFGQETKPDGCLDSNEADHNGLPSVRSVVDPVCSAHAAYLSRADCWVLAGIVAIEEAGGVAPVFRFGRIDCDDEAQSDDSDPITGTSLLPSANPGGNPFEHVMDVFHSRAELSVREIVALMGAHSLGRPSSDADSNSGFSDLPWVRNTAGATLTSKFYRDISAVSLRCLRYSRVTRHFNVFS